MKEEHRLFRDSIMQFENFIENKKEAMEDLLISKEDIIKKFLGFLRFWKEMGSSKGSAIFILKTLRHIVERSEKERSMSALNNSFSSSSSSSSSASKHLDP